MFKKPKSSQLQQVFYYFMMKLAVSLTSASSRVSSCQYSSTTWTLLAMTSTRTYEVSTRPTTPLKSSVRTLVSARMYVCSCVYEWVCVCVRVCVRVCIYYVATWMILSRWKLMKVMVSNCLVSRVFILLLEIIFDIHPNEWILFLFFYMYQVGFDPNHQFLVMVPHFSSVISTWNLYWVNRI